MLHDKIASNENLTQDEAQLVEQIKGEPLFSKFEKGCFEEYNQPDGPVSDFNTTLFKNVEEKYHVMARLKYFEYGKIAEEHGL